ncbi:hypothetical protein WJS89_05295 [Sphingomicrobium sp. XHP0235]|uniref:hypothetical protein n=1 Tax=Sphingomicrobium aquimarinum TaxID=3133971 RepID=UPI0031FED0A6
MLEDRKRFGDHHRPPRRAVSDGHGIGIEIVRRAVHQHGLQMRTPDRHGRVPFRREMRILQPAPVDRRVRKSRRLASPPDMRARAKFLDKGLLRPCAPPPRPDTHLLAALRDKLGARRSVLERTDAHPFHRRQRRAPLLGKPCRHPPPCIYGRMIHPAARAAIRTLPHRDKASRKRCSQTVASRRSMLHLRSR